MFRAMKLVLVVATFAAMEVASFAQADTPPMAKPVSEQAALALEIRQLVDELQSVRRDASSEDKKHQDGVARVRRQIDTLTNQLGPAEEAAKDQRAQIEKLEKSIADDRQKAVDTRSWIAQLAIKAGPAADAAAERSKHYAAEDPAGRTLAFAETAKLIRDEESARQASGIKELTRLYSDEWLPARTVGLANQQVILDDGARSHHAWVYRLGLVSKVFVAEGGAPVGVWQGNPQSPWKLDVSEETRQQIHELMDVAREQQAPAIVAVPIEIKAASVR
jgi:hypothetical protein